MSTRSRFNPRADRVDWWGVGLVAAIFLSGTASVLLARCLVALVGRVW